MTNEFQNVTVSTYDSEVSRNCVRSAFQLISLHVILYPLSFRQNLFKAVLERSYFVKHKYRDPNEKKTDQKIFSVLPILRRLKQKGT